MTDKLSRRLKNELKKESNNKKKINDFINVKLNFLRVILQINSTQLIMTLLIVTVSSFKIDVLKNEKE